MQWNYERWRHKFVIPLGHLININQPKRSYPEIKYKDVYRKTIESQHHTSILEANYYISIYNVYFKVALATE